MKKLKTAFLLLNDFNNFIDNRSIISLVVFKEIFPNILEWHFKIWKKDYEYLYREKMLDEWGTYDRILEILNSTIKRIEQRVFREEESFSFFKYFKKHAEGHKTEVFLSNNGERYYVDSLLNTFYQVFFEEVTDSTQHFQIWQHCFPPEWKITKDNLEDKKNLLARITRDEFVKWSQPRIWKYEEEFDRELDDVSTNLFPEVEPNMWAKILIYIFSHYGENPMKSVIERPWNFGYGIRIKPHYYYRGEKEEDSGRRQYEMEVKKTFELAYLLFPSEFSKENLEKNIENLKALEYGKGSKEEKKRLELLNIFIEMLKFSDQK